jgi:hypothetical protein
MAQRFFQCPDGSRRQSNRSSLFELRLPHPKLSQSPTTQRTFPIAGAPHLPANPLLKMMSRLLNKKIQSE